MKKVFSLKIICLFLAFACVLFYIEAIYSIVSYAQKINWNYITECIPAFISAAFLFASFCIYAITIFIKKENIAFFLLCTAMISVFCSFFGSIIKIDLYYFIIHFNYFSEIAKTLIFRFFRFILPISLFTVSLITILIQIKAGILKIAPDKAATRKQKKIDKLNRKIEKLKKD